MAFVYITCKDKKEARKIARALLEKRLIACANLFPVESLFQWKGKLTEEKETALLCKTEKRMFARIRKAVAGMHSYEVPCVCMLDAKSSDDFSQWVKESLN